MKMASNGRSSLVAAIAVGLVLGAATEGRATSIVINNSSFETPPLGDGIGATGPSGPAVVGWVFSSNQNGIYNPTAAQGTPTDGVNVGYINDGTISQVLTGVLLTANTLYTLDVDVVRRNDFAGTGDIFLFAGATQLGTDSKNPLAANSAETATVSFFASALDPNLGQTLEIRLVKSVGNQALFDNARLDATLQAANGDPVPEPATLILLGTGLAGLARFSRKRKA